MIIDHAGGLHECVADGRADKAESMRAQGLAHGIGFRGAGRNILWSLPVVEPWSSLHERPQPGIETSVAHNDFARGAGIVPRGKDFEAVADQSAIFKQGLQFHVRHGGNAGNREIVEAFAVVRPLGQHGAPAEASLRTFEHEEFKERVIAVQPPLRIRPMR